MKYFLTTCLFISALVFAWVNYQSHWKAPESAPASLHGSVVDIIDGDSFKLRTKDGLHRVELHGIDAPEPGQPFGNMSTYYLTDLIDGRDVEILQVETNEYGDIIAEVRIDGLSINQLMLTQGYAWAKRGYFDDRKWLGMEQLARKSGLGLWRSGDPMPPWDWREAQQKG
jgi:endonuclease YncB( thermonuclease family)